MKKCYSIFVFLCLTLCLSSCKNNKVPTVEGPSVVDVEIIEMNDIHGHIEQNVSYKSGISNAAYAVVNSMHITVIDAIKMFKTFDFFIS